MELRVLVLGGDPGIREMLRAQAQNVGCTCNEARDVGDAGGVVEWAEAAIVDLAGEGFGGLERLRAERAELPVLAIATDDAQADAATDAGAQVVLTEPFAIPDLVEAIRRLGREGSAEVIDLRKAEHRAEAVEDDLPWWATR